MAKEVDIEIKRSSFLALTAARMDNDKGWIDKIQKRWKEYYIALLGLQSEEDRRDRDLMEEYEAIRHLRPTLKVVDGVPTVEGIE